ncbi:conserved hypothetical protein [Alteromonas macleodii]|jgi:hypothetical protein
MSKNNLESREVEKAQIINLIYEYVPEQYVSLLSQIEHLTLANILRMINAKHDHSYQLRLASNNVVISYYPTTSSPSPKFTDIIFIVAFCIMTKKKILDLHMLLSNTHKIKFSGENTYEIMSSCSHVNYSKDSDTIFYRFDASGMHLFLHNLKENSEKVSIDLTLSRYALKKPIYNVIEKSHPDISLKVVSANTCKSKNF